MKTLDVTDLGGTLMRDEIPYNGEIATQLPVCLQSEVGYKLYPA